MNIIQTKDLKFLKQIVEQYIRVFSTGQSAQLIDIVELNQYVHTILTRGYAVLAIENDELVGSLLSTPLVLDKELPSEIATKFEMEQCIYIAELMVKEDKRGMGIGRKLIEVFYNMIDWKIYSDVFIRVWDENKGALRLYEQSGFQPIAKITQTKIAMDGFTKYDMNKIYLHKRID